MALGIHNEKGPSQGPFIGLIGIFSGRGEEDLNVRPVGPEPSTLVRNC
jgi:hypothetical protein